MLNVKEIGVILLATAILAFTLTIGEGADAFFASAGIVVTVIMINVVAKKIAADNFDATIEIKFWEWTHVGVIGALLSEWIGLSPNHKFKRPFPLGVIVPFFVAILSLGYLAWLAVLSFNAKEEIHRVAKRHEFHSMTHLKELHIGYIATTGVFANVIFALLGSMVGLEAFALLNAAYALFNLVPLGELDGNKILFSYVALWIFSIFFAAAVFLVTLLA